MLCTKNIILTFIIYIEISQIKSYVTFMWQLMFIYFYEYFIDQFGYRVSHQHFSQTLGKIPNWMKFLKCRMTCESKISPIITHIRTKQRTDVEITLVRSESSLRFALTSFVTIILLYSTLCSIVSLV